LKDLLSTLGKVVNAMKKQESIHAKSSKEDDSLQQVALCDMDHLRLKLIKVKEKKTNRRGPIDVDMHDIEYTLVVYLLSRMPKEHTNISRNIKLQLESEAWSLGQGAFGLVKEVMWLTHNCASKITALGGEKKEVILKSYNHSQIVQFLCCWKDHVKKKTSSYEEDGGRSQQHVC
jgi:hypothetical protein